MSETRRDSSSATKAAVAALAMVMSILFLGVVVLAGCETAEEGQQPAGASFSAAECINSANPLLDYLTRRDSATGLAAGEEPMTDEQLATWAAQVKDACGAGGDMSADAWEHGSEYVECYTVCEEVQYEPTYAAG